MWNVFKVNKQRFHRNIILVSVLLTLNSFHILLLCFRWWLWKNKYQLGCNAHEKLFFTCLVQFSLMILAWYGYIDISRKKILKCPNLKSGHIRSYYGPYFPKFGLNTDQNISEYGQFLLKCCPRITCNSWNLIYWRPYRGYFLPRRFQGFSIFHYT